MSAIGSQCNVLFAIILVIKHLNNEDKNIIKESKSPSLPKEKKVQYTDINLTLHHKSDISVHIQVAMETILITLS